MVFLKNIYLFLECLSVGFYCSFLYLLFDYTLKFSPLSSIFAMFLFGFAKHFLGYVLGLHYLYCHYTNYMLYQSTLEDIKKISIFNFDIDKLINTIIDSVGEGIVFCIIYLVAKYIYRDYFKYLGYEWFFIVGIILHFLAEIFGFHNQFCQPNKK